VMRRSQRNVFCLDATKLERNAPHFLVPWTEVGTLLTDASPARLEKAGIPRVFHSPAEVAESPEAQSGDMPVHIL
jgi:hypothetical protein